MYIDAAGKKWFKAFEFIKKSVLGIDPYQIDSELPLSQDLQEAQSAPT